MMTTMPLPPGPAEPPVKGLPSERPSTKTAGASGGRSDSFASTLDEVRSKEEAPHGIDRSRAQAEHDAKPAKDGGTAPETPADSENAEAAAAEGKPTPELLKAPMSAAAPPDGKASTQTSESGTPNTSPESAPSKAANGVLETPNFSRTGKPAEAASKPGLGATKGDAMEAAVKETAGIDQAVSSKATTGVVTASAADRRGEGASDSGALLGEAAGKKTLHGETRSVEGSGGDKASTVGGDALQTKQTAGDTAFSDRQPSNHQAARQGENLPTGRNTESPQIEPGGAENEGRRTEGREASPRPIPSGDRPAEAGRAFSDALQERAAPLAKDDAGAMTPRQSTPDGSPVFSPPAAGPKTAAAATGSATMANPAAPTAESFAQDNFHQLVERALFSVRGGQSEARIALKPDHMGPVRMQIVTENQAVSIKIFTESPVARDLIDANAHQLRSELQQQGLNVQSIEVAVSDGDQDAHRGARQREAFQRLMSARGASPGEEENHSPVLDAGDQVPGRRSAGGIDYFA